MSAKKESERLMNDLLPFAEKMLKEHGEFHPFGGAIKSDGSIVHVGASAGEEFPRGKDLVGMLKESFREQARRGEISVAAIVANVSVEPPDSDNKVDAAEVAIDHRDDYAVRVFFPYVISEGQVSLGAPFASESERFAFG
jgi:hypothetical protein